MSVKRLRLLRVLHQISLLLIAARTSELFRLPFQQFPCFSSYNKYTSSAVNSWKQSKSKLIEQNGVHSEKHIFNSNFLCEDNIQPLRLVWQKPSFKHQERDGMCQNCIPCNPKKKIAFDHGELQNTKKRVYGTTGQIVQYEKTRI